MTDCRWDIRLPQIITDYLLNRDRQQIRLPQTITDYLRDRQQMRHQTTTDHHRLPA